MSTTFHIPEAPHRSVRRPCTSPEMGLVCRAGDRCGYCDDGFEEDVETDAPTVNLSGVNASVVLNIIGYHEYGDRSCGTVPHGRIGDTLQRILRAINTDGVVDAHVRPAHDELGELGARSVDFGEDAEDVLARIERVRDVLVYAAHNGYAVSWD